MDRETQKEKSLQEKEQKRLQEEAERRQEKEEAEIRKQQKRLQDETEREQRRREKEDAELKEQLAVKRQASLMERFLKKRKTDCINQNDQPSADVSSDSSSVFSSQQAPESIIRSMDNALAQSIEVNTSNLQKLHVASWQKLGQSIRSNRNQHRGLRRKPKTELIKEIKLSSCKDIVCENEPSDVKLPNTMEDSGVEDSRNTMDADKSVCGSQKGRRRKHILSEIKASSLKEKLAAVNPILEDLRAEQVSEEMERLKTLKASRMKQLAMNKRSEFEEICRVNHMEPDTSTTTEKVCTLIDAGLVDPSELLSSIDSQSQIAKANKEATSRQDIMDRIGRWLSACEEEIWLDDYNQDVNRYSVGRGANINLKRAERARVTVSKIPTILYNLIVKTLAREEFKSYLGWHEQGDVGLFCGLHVDSGRMKGHMKRTLREVTKKNNAVAYRCRMVKVLKVGYDVIQPHKHGPFKVNEVIHLEENSGSSSFEVEETDVGAFWAPK